jgi:hypothetical protein
MCPLSHVKVSLPSALTVVKEARSTAARCDKEISPKRLQAVPWAAYCVACQDAVDDQGRPGGRCIFWKILRIYTRRREHEPVGNNVFGVGSHCVTNRHPSRTSFARCWTIDFSRDGSELAVLMERATATGFTTELWIVPFPSGRPRRVRCRNALVVAWQWTSFCKSRGPLPPRHASQRWDFHLYSTSATCFRASGVPVNGCSTTGEPCNDIDPLMIIIGEFRPPWPWKLIEAPRG